MHASSHPRQRNVRLVRGPRGSSRCHVLPRYGREPVYGKKQQQRAAISRRDRKANASAGDLLVEIQGISWWKSPSILSAITNFQPNTNVVALTGWWW